MRQLELFSRTQLSVLRDSSKARHRSPEVDAFRREHERRRAWGLRQRHALKMTRLYGSVANAQAEFRRRAEERTTSAPACLAGPEAPGHATTVKGGVEGAVPLPAAVGRIVPERAVAERALSDEVVLEEVSERAACEQVVPEQHISGRAVVRQAVRQLGLPEGAVGEWVVSRQAVR